MKPIVFISHIHSESKLAVWLEEKISDLLLGAINFFVSSDKTSIVGGDKWLLKIEEALKNASVVLVICSKESVVRPWINFEAGGAWIAGKRVVPICHSGMSPQNLPEPMKSLQSYELTNEEHFRELVSQLSKEAGLREPKFDAVEILKSIPNISGDISTAEESSLIEILGGKEKVGTGWLMPEPDPRDLWDSHGRVSVLRKKLRIPAEDHKDRNPALPSTVDLRQWCPEAKNQGVLNSCTAHAVVSMIEYFDRRTYNNFSEGSRLFVYKQARNLMHLKGDSGATLRSTLSAVNLFGVPPNKFWPYTDKKPNFDIDPPTHVFSLGLSLQGAVYFSHDPMHRNLPKQFILAKVKAYLAASIPSVFGFYVYPSFENSNFNGAIPLPKSDEMPKWKQAVLAVGYDDAKIIENSKGSRKSTGALLFLNSWGQDWGQNGYGWLPYDYVLEGCALDFWSLFKVEWLDTKQFGI